MSHLKKILLLFFLVTPFLSYSQTYHPFPDSLGRWSVAGGGCVDCQGSPGIYCHEHGWIYSQAGDTFINGKEYSLIGFNSKTWFKSYQVSGNVTGIGNNNYILPGQIIGAIREDTSKKIWFRRLDSIPNSGYPWWIPNDEALINSFPKDSDILLYDFSLKVGSVFSIPIGNNFYKCHLKVTSIDSLRLTNGKYRRILNLTPCSSGIGSQYWIDGIGSSLGLFGSYQSLGECSGTKLHCFQLDDSLFYTKYISGTIDCDHVFVSTEDIRTDLQFSISPQPASDYFTVTLNTNSPSSMLTISNLMGQTVYRKQLTEQSTLIHTNEIGTPGIYICHIKELNGNTLIKKLLLQ